MDRNADRQSLDELVAEPQGGHLLVRHRTEPAADAGPRHPAPAQLIVLISPRARQVPSLVAALPALLRPLPEGVRSLCVALPGLAADPAPVQVLAKELDIEVLAPDGEFVPEPAAAWYAGHGSGGTGWWRFRPDAPPAFAGARLPAPRWEGAVPVTAVPLDAATVAEPVAAGILLRSVDAPAAGVGHPAFTVPVDEHFPKVLVGGAGPVPTPAAVAAVLDRLAPVGPVLVPVDPGASSHVWQAELALRTGREVLFTPGVPLGPALATALTPEGEPLFQPFPALLRQTARGGDQQVLEVGPPPTGWTRSGPRTYRLGAGETAVYADVVPSGLVLRPASPECAAEIAPFDPTGWTLTLGTPGDVVGLRLLVAAERLVAGLDPGRRAVVRVRVGGELDEQAGAILHRMAEALPSPRVPPTGPAPAVPPVEPAVPVAEPAVPLAEPAPLPRPPVSYAAPPIATMSSVPVSTVSEPRRPAEQPVPEPEAPAAGTTPETGQVPAEPVVQAPVPLENTEDVPIAEVPEAEAPEEPHPVQQAEDESPAAPVEPAPVEPAEAAAAGGPAKPLVPKDRPSTTAEQNRFAVAAGEAFTEALATVNAALAAWPSMRQGDANEAKADYVAVCLYLGRGETGATQVNGAVRAGRKGPVDAQLPCLVSGIRRLPTHRRAVLRQGRVGESLEHQSSPGTVLTEPGFLTGSMDLDVTVPGADLDVLIWPASARRTSELMISRPMNEVVFAAGARFKALAVRTAEDGDDDGEGGDERGEGVSAPRVAVLFRELTPGESPGTELDERDLIVLAKLDRVLASRQQGGVRVVEDPEVAARLTTSLLEWQPEAAEPELAGHAAAATR
ncbi:hypothetical protein FNH05_01030 [Amycolatopsis rhizosphaerae]|uniref:Uncharacterized protein n=1 Tax=Amycolatopsis rhizosphaerae TaxID=2053003 RepID=A0A558DNA4_9PSEU|nr:hypothetical protein [Amycolatopsis rhizosphaerae]TVT62502.1 hypothetical protein FNH05_01030 [Amycolatopsis rhizosphaerae]